MADLIYLDAAASTPIAPEAFETTMQVMLETGNAGSAHLAGHTAAARVDRARVLVAELMSVGPAGVVFVGSATEANNLALRGLVRQPDRSDVVVTSTDHPSVLATVDDIVSEHGRSHRVRVNNTGEVDLDNLQAVLGPGTAIVSVHAANNETGVIQPLEEIAAQAHQAGALVHADASQLMAWGPSPILDHCDLVTVSSHKMHGPQGAAALIIRPTARERLKSQMTGGGQERGLRSGTVNVAAVSGFGTAAELSLSSGAESAKQVKALRARLMDGLKSSFDDVIEHGADARRRAPGILNTAFGMNRGPAIESELLLARLPRLAASTGSACHAGVPGPSPVLLEMGVSTLEAARSIRMSLNRYTTIGDVDAALGELRRGYTELFHLLGGSELEERY